MTNLNFYLVVTLAPTRPGQKRFAVIAYMAFPAVSLLPVVGETLMDFESETDRDWYEVLFLGPLLYLFGPLVQILGLAALRAQAREISSPGSDTTDALSVRGLVAQAVIFLLVGVSFVFHMRVPSEDQDEHLIINLQTWYWTVGWATINNVIFAVAQGVLAWIAWRHTDDEGEGDLNERSALLEN